MLTLMTPRRFAPSGRCRSTASALLHHSLRSQSLGATSGKAGARRLELRDLASQVARCTREERKRLQHRRPWPVSHERILSSATCPDDRAKFATYENGSSRALGITRARSVSCARVDARASDLIRCRGALPQSYSLRITTRVHEGFGTAGNRSAVGGETGVGNELSAARSTTTSCARRRRDGVVVRKPSERAQRSASRCSPLGSEHRCQW